MTASAPCDATVLPACTPAPPLASTLAVLSCACHSPVSVSAMMNQRARPNLGSTRESISLLCALMATFMISPLPNLDSGWCHHVERSVFMGVQFQGAFSDEGGDRLERFAVVDPQAGGDVGHRAWTAREQRQDVRAGRDSVAAGRHGVGDHLGVGREQPARS